MEQELLKAQNVRSCIDSDGCETLRNRILPSYTLSALRTGFHVEQAFYWNSEYRNMNLSHIAEGAYHAREGLHKSVPRLVHSVADMVEITCTR